MRYFSLASLRRKMWGWVLIYWNVVNASTGHNVSHFLDRKGTSKGRRFMWRVLLTLTFLLPVLPLCWVALIVLGSLGGTLLGLGLGGVYAYGALKEIWRDGHTKLGDPGTGGAYGPARYKMEDRRKQP